ncbi:MAG: hypothetical protein H0X41_02325 [Chitinophagaceae bacterium]|nr:hypothetical protein [Chitinophagaceae bacterium]
MKSNKNLTLILLLLIVVAAFYRIIPNRPMGFAPHLAMALFAGAVIRDKKWAFAFPIFSMFISDLIYQLLYLKGLTALSGFYEGQITNYLLFAGLVIVGFFMKKINLVNVALFSLTECVLFFLVSNFFVWINGAGFGRPKTPAGFVQCYVDAVPFFGNSVLATLVFSGILFGAYQLFRESGNVVPVRLASK